MYSIIVDNWISRRKRTNHVLDNDGELVLTSSDFLSCIEFLDEEGQSSCIILRPDANPFILTISWTKQNPDITPELPVDDRI